MTPVARRKLEALAYFLGFIACIPLANWMIGHVGTVCVPQGPCLVPVAPPDAKQRFLARFAQLAEAAA